MVAGKVTNLRKGGNGSNQHAPANPPSGGFANGHARLTQREAAKIANLRHGGDRGNQHSGGKPPDGGLANGHAQLSQIHRSRPAVRRLY